MNEEYYTFDSLVLIKIQHPNGNIETRPLMVGGMKRHTAMQLEQLRSKKVWTIAELREIEGW